MRKIVGLSISQWLPCTLAIWNLLFGMAILLNLVKLQYSGFMLMLSSSVYVSLTQAEHCITAQVGGITYTPLLFVVNFLII